MSQKKGDNDPEDECQLSDVQEEASSMSANQGIVEEGKQSSGNVVSHIQRNNISSGGGQQSSDRNSQQMIVIPNPKSPVKV